MCESALDYVAKQDAVKWCESLQFLELNLYVKERLHGSPRFINAVESTKGSFAHFWGLRQGAKPVGPNSKFYSGGLCPLLGST
jgi:hypothetical protein